jgi:hypothetical protein
MLVLDIWLVDGDKGAILQDKTPLSAFSTAIVLKDGSTYSAECQVKHSERDRKRARSNVIQDH